HPEQSSYYERVESFTPFTEVADCLESGGRLPKGLIIGDARPASGYSRSKFGYGWKDVDGNGYDARADALISQSTGAIVFDPDNPKRVARGRWIVPYSGKIITNASETDADHVVPLNFAWRHGADKWSDDRRVQFANDPRNILITSASHNRSTITI
ncbi:DUF1524 domain-containing protein, partial [Pseudoalteromonas sp. GABNS16G]|uniref:GmrSD restriction endonuclease domain-containing protein n=1 Tax=Pseudoalteromonas sp. GABNS16G TaxID=3025324 RepID=UPI002359F95E